MILIDNLIQSKQFRIVRTKIKDIEYCGGLIPVYHYKWTPIINPGCKNLILLPLYTLTHVDNKKIIGNFSLLCINELYIGTESGKEIYDQRMWKADKTVFAQIYFVMRILQWYSQNPDYADKSLMKYLNKILKQYEEFYTIERLDLKNKKNEQ